MVQNNIKTVAFDGLENAQLKISIHQMKKLYVTFSTLF
jgi:hypothetical protein